MNNIISISEYRVKQNIKDELAHGRNPLYVSHLTGKITGSSSREPKQDFGDRLSKVRASIEKINRLMRELKELNEQGKIDVR